MEKERLLFTIERFDQYFESVNNKSNIELGIASFIVGGIVAIYPSLLEHIELSIWIKINFFSIVSVGICAMLFIILALKPHLTPKSNSVIYFQSIANKKKEEFESASEKYSDLQELADLREQTYLLATGLSNKYKRLKLSTWILALQIFLLLPFISLVIINQK
jgi:hypothetical protein